MPTIELGQAAKVDDLTEKVARAIAALDPHCGPYEDYAGEKFTPQARAAIRAVLDGIREPDDGTKGTGHMKAVAYLDRFSGLSLEDTGAVFAAMIDKLRKRYD